MTEKKTRLLCEDDVIKAVDKHTNDDGSLDDDISICKWGSVGKIIEKGKEGTYHKELYIKCNNDNLREKVVETIKNIDWENFVISSKSPTISPWMIRKYLKEHIPELE